MVLEDTKKELEQLGFTINPKVISIIKNPKRSLPITLKPLEKEIFRDILLLKAADFALVEGTHKIGLKEYEKIMWLCIPFLFPCLRSTFLENPDITSLIITPGDVRIMNKIGITTNKQILKINSEETANKIMKHFEKNNIKITKKQEILLKSRLQLWTRQAKLLATLTKE